MPSRNTQPGPGPKLLVALLLILLAASASRAADTPAPAAAANGPSTFPTPERAVEALVTAAKNADTATLLAIFGPEAREVLTSGDAVADRRARDVFVVAAGQGWKLNSTDADHRELVIGDEQWPFPIPLVRQGDAWRFDIEAGKKEVRARRIGRNELTAIGICEAYVAAQKQYAAEAHDGNPAGAYAQKIASTPGRHDGLFWHTEPGEKHSPLGDLAAKAAAEGYTAAHPSDPNQGPHPLRGYLFRILTAQGSAAPGGAKSYIVDGKMTAGFALIAYPVQYGNSGITTFIVNQDGVVQEADLGPDTPKLAAAITAYDPDPRFEPAD